MQERSVVPTTLIDTVRNEYMDVSQIMQSFKTRRAYHDAEQWRSRQDVLKMFALLEQNFMVLMREASVCRQRKKITTAFWNEYNRFNSSREVLLGNITMYKLMYA